MNETILVLNAGSSSIKFELFAVGGRDQLACCLKGQVEGIGARARLQAKGTDGKTIVDETWPSAEANTVSAALDKVLIFLRGQIGGKLPTAIGHRVAHVGPTITSRPSSCAGTSTDG